jgi:addiction module HigA family antidote
MQKMAARTFKTKDTRAINHYTPVHPGEVLRDELEEIGLTQSALAKHIGVLPKTINEIIRGKRGISAEMAMKLSKALGGSPQFWLNLQNNWELSRINETAKRRLIQQRRQTEHPVDNVLGILKRPSSTNRYIEEVRGR